MPHYLFQFGHSPKLARLELATCLVRLGIKYQQDTLNPSLHLLHTKSAFDTRALISSLGGTIRIALSLRSCDADFLPQAIASFLKSSHKPTFSISSLDPNLDTIKLMSVVKANLKQQNIPSRFITADQGFLAPIQLESQGVAEFILVPVTKDQYHLFQTQAVTDYKSWVARDRHRPTVDPRSGMLPPKIARIMVNLGLNQPLTADTTLYDPFCGSGTILAEALSLGVNVIGSDIDSQAVANTRQNLDWLEQTFSSTAKFDLFVSDASALTPDYIPSPTSAIVTEVYLGPATRQTVSELQGTISSLTSLYQRVLPHLKQFLTPTGRLVIALPKYRSAASVKMLRNLVDTCENAGYTLISGPLIYSQPGARVQRAIYIFENK